MNRTAALTDFLLVTLAVTVILLSLLPLVLPQQSPLVTTGAEKLSKTTAVEVHLSDIDPNAAVVRWQNETAAFYALRESGHSESVASAAVQTVSYDEPTAAKPMVLPPKSNPTAATRFGVVIQDRRMSMTFVFAIFGGVLVGLGYFEWSRQTPVVKPTMLEIATDNEPHVTVDLQPQWATVSQRSAVKLRRSVLGILVFWALVSVIV